MEAKGLRNLTLHMTSAIFKPRTDYNNGELNLQFKPGDNFPPLEKLTLDCHDQYSLSTAHCKMWTKCMDWRCLKTMDLGHATPQHLIRALSGHVPLLKSLRFGFGPNGHGPKATWNSPADLEVVKNFVDSLDALQSIIFCSWNDTECAEIRPALLAKYGYSLKMLKHELDFHGAWKLEHVGDLRDKTRQLEELEITIAMEQVNAPQNERSRWPSAVQCVL